MIHVGRISYELGLFNAHFDSKNNDLIPAPELKHMFEIPESRHWVLEEDPVFSERALRGVHLSGWKYSFPGTGRCYSLCFRETGRCLGRPPVKLLRSSAS